LRRLAAAAIAAPVIATTYLVAAWRRPSARRLGAGLFLAVLGVSGLLLAASPQASSSGPSAAATPLAETQFVPLSVAPRSMELPMGGLPPDLAAAAAPIAAPAVHAALVPAPRVTLKTSRPGRRIPLNGTFQIQLTRPVSIATLRAALSITPSVKGRLAPAKGDQTGRAFVFTPTQRLIPNTAYTIAFSGPLKDASGIVIHTPKPLRTLTVTSPRVVRTRPATKVTDVEREAVISVRFSQPMNTSTVARALSVTVAGKRVAGKISWLEGRTVLVFDPTTLLPYSARVTVRIAATAQSADAAPLVSAFAASFTVVPRPAAHTSASSPSKPRSGSSGGGVLGGGAWAAVESYYLSLMNCTRTGGWVTSSGHCDSPGGRDVAPLWIDRGISDRVTRPYARYVVMNGICSHFADGTPGTRLARAGYDSYRWAENMSCPKGMNPKAAMLNTQLFFQSEKPYNGGHYVNLMNPDYDRVGIGVWVAGGQVEVVIDFYHP